ncbi:hypothetical protein [Nocardia camponoti]|uniref:hypothetical protein n=1 Tax=Nocardia camponoti TaxID=1616106 RepID=UPI00166B2285|nr:hypothetical protein [Nocardia camponoti]
MRGFSAVVIVSAVLALAGCGSDDTSSTTAASPSTTSAGKPPSTGSTTPDANPGAACGTVTYPQTGVTATVRVDSGTISCPDALLTLTKYVTDATVLHTGDTWTSSFDGWQCMTPQVADRQPNQVLSECTRGGTRIITN